MKKTKKKRVAKRTTEKHSPNKRWFLDVLEQKGMSQALLAREVGITKSSLSKVLNGKQRLKLAESTKMAGALARPLEEVLNALGVALGASEPGGGTIEVGGWIDGAKGLLLRGKDQGGGLKGSRTAPCPFPDKDIRAARIQSTGTEYDGLDGALVYFRESRAKGVHPELVGRVALVKVTGGAEERALRVVRRGYGGGGRYNLTSLSGKLLEENVGIESAYPVVWLKF